MQAAARKPRASTPGITAFCITQVYNDHGIVNSTEQGAGNERCGKFVLSLTEGVTQSDVESISVSGPNGYSFAVRPHVPFAWPADNGYIEDKRLNETWYMGFDKRGFLDDGLYTITVLLKDGQTDSCSRWLTANHAMLDAYLAHRDSIVMAPEGLWRPEAGESMRLRWTTLKELAGVDAFYCARLSRGWPFIKGDDLDFYDNIFAADRDNSAGLNKAGVDVPIAFERGDRFTWFAEIVDSNCLEEINLAIFEPFKRFQVG